MAKELCPVAIYKIMLLGKDQRGSFARLGTKFQPLGEGRHADMLCDGGRYLAMLCDKGYNRNTFRFCMCWCRKAVSALRERLNHA